MDGLEWKNLKTDRLHSLEVQKRHCLSVLFAGVDNHDWSRSFDKFSLDDSGNPSPFIQIDQHMPQYCDWYSKFIVKSAKERYNKTPLQLHFQYEKEHVIGWKGSTVIPSKVIVKAHLFPPEQ